MFLRKSPLRKALYFVSALSVLFFMSGSQVLAWGVDAEWIDRANIKVNRIEFDDDDNDELSFNISDETEAIVKSFGGNAKVREVINNENKGTYKDSSIADDTYEYVKPNCKRDSVLDLGNSNIDNSRADVLVQRLAYTFTTQGWPYDPCEDFIQSSKHFGGIVKANIPIKNSAKKDIWFVASDDLKILRKVDGADGEYKPRDGGDPNIYYASAGASCDGSRNRVTIDPATKSQAVISGTYKHCLGRNDTVSVKIEKQSAHGDNNIFNSAGDASPSCESNNSNIVMSWIICGIINALDGFAKTAGDTIDSLLTLRSDDFSNSQELKVVWSLFRNTATFMLVAVALFMLLGQTLGAGGEALFSAYTMRKVLPRLLIAAISIQLSWYIMIELINAVNDVSHGIEGLLYAPFGGVSQFSLGNILGQANVNQGLFSGLAAGTGVAVLGYGLTAGSGTIAGVLALAATAVVGLLIAMFTLILRRAILIGLILISPLALALWVLPNTEKLWKLWYESFSKLIIVYPLILFVIAAGRLFAYTAAATRGQNKFSQMAIIVMGTVGVFALVPAMLKLAGAAYNFAAGSLNDPRKGFFDRMRNIRKSEAEKSKAKFLAGDRYNRNNFAARAVNRLGAGIAVGRTGHFGIGSQGSRAIANLKNTAADNYLKENARLAKLGQTNDDATAIVALSGGTQRGAAQAAERLRQHWIQNGQAADVATARARNALQSARSVGITQRGAVAALGLMSQNKSRAIAAGGFDVVDEGIQRLGNPQLAQEAAYGFQWASRGAGRLDLGGDWTSNANRAHLDAARAAATPQEREMHLANARRAVLMDAISRTDTRSLVSGHDNTTIQARNVVAQDFNSGDYARMMESGVMLNELAGNLASATGGNRDNIMAALDAAGIQVHDPQNTGAIEQQIVARINAAQPPAHVTPEALRSYSRTWGSGTPLADRGGPNPPPPGPGTPP